MNGRILLTALLSAFAGIVWAGETVLNEKSSRLLNTDGETYVVRESLTFKGDDGTGQSGLSVAEGVHVKIRIEKDATLTCIGGSGANAAAGGDGRTPRFDTHGWQSNEWGIDYEVMTFKAASAGAGADSGGGGGAGILVPATSSLTVFGEGALVATGGAGGAGGKGGASAMGAFHVISWVGLAGSAIDANWDYLVWSNRFHSADGLTTIISGTASANHYNWWYNAQPASGGGGGGGAGGGGAGIGLPGLAGGEGGNGGAVQSVWGGEDTKVLATVSGSSGAAAANSAAKCGVVRLALVSAKVSGGAGGSEGAGGTDGGAKDDQLVWCYDAAGQRTTKVDLHMYSGRAGGGGGAGGKGADFGTGGGGGAGGNGGYSGGIAFNPTTAPSWASNIGTNGLVGTEGNAIQPLIPIGFFVNGTDVGDLSGTGWTYDVKEKILTLNSAMTYVLSGEATNNEVQVHAAASGATAVLSNAVVFASERPAVVVAQGASLMVAANQVLLAGGTPETMRYATDCGQNSCVLAGPAVTVTVKDIPHVADVVVSNRMETISRATVEGGVAYRVMKGDDIFVGYTVEKGYTSKSDNPLVYPAVESDVTVDANTIRVLPHIPYRAWNETTRQMEDLVCTDYTVVTADTDIFADGQWYAVTGAVSRGTITVNGSAHLILCDGARLTCDGAKPNAYHCGEPGILLNDPHTLSVYGQAEGTGTLEALGADDCAGIGSGAGDSPTAGSLTVDGGVVLATGQYYGAGIGGSNTFWWQGYGNGGTVTVNGGRVTASGGPFAAGIGGGSQGRGAAVTIRGGTVASQGGQGGFGHGNGYGVSDNGSLTIDGGSVKAQTAAGLAKNSATKNVYCVTAKVEGLNVERLNVEGLGNYGTNDIYAIDGRAYLWLPDGVHRFSVSDGTTSNRYLAVVNGEDVAAERLGPIGFFANGTDVGDAGVGDGWIYFGRVLSLTNAISYVLSGAASNNEVQVNVAASGATAVLSNAVVFASERPAVVLAQGATLTVAANQVLMAGESPGTMRYATDCGQNSCVLAGHAVTVTVKDIPHVTGFTVSNAVETITNATGEASCRVMAGDDVFVGYVVEEGYFSKSANPLVYAAVESDVTVDAGTIRILKNIPYRAWNEATWQMENKVCTNYTVVVEGTQAFADGQWYAVTGAVERGSITVNGAAHLILCDGAKLTATGGENVAGVKVESGNALTIYGQTLGTGELVATCGRKGAGIGSGINADCGSVTINGGTVTAKGGWDGAGIGSGEYWTGTTQGNSEITINGGRVKAVGDGCGAGIGGGWGHHGGVLVINGGTVEAVAGWNGGFSLGDSAGEGNLMRVMINGGSVKADKIKTQPTNSANAAVWCVTAKVEGLRVEKLRVEGLGSYGTNDIYAVDNRVYLWLPKGTHRFSISDGTTTYNYCAVMKGVAITVEPLAPVGFFVNGEDIGDKGSGTGWDYNKNMKNLTLSEVGLYVLSGVAMNDEVHIHVAGEKAAGATVILSNAVVFVSGQPPALNVDQNISLLMAGGSSFLGATNNVMAISVGPKAALTVGLAPGADETEAIIGVFNYGDVAAIGGAGSVTVRGGTLAVWADKRAAETPINRTADVLCMLAGNDPETAKVVDTYNGEPYVLVTAAIAPVTPGTPFGPFTTAEAATNAANKAVLNPRDDVVTKLGAGSSALATYCNMFTFAVTGGGESWYAEAVLYPEAWTNVTLSAQEATRQIPVADIAALPLNTPTNVTAKSCGVPGFFYSCYSGGTVTNLTALAAEGGRNVLCGPDRDVKFEGAVKPSAAAGFFTIGVKEAPSVTPSDRAELDPPARMGASGLME